MIPPRKERYTMRELEMIYRDEVYLLFNDDNMLMEAKRQLWKLFVQYLLMKVYVVIHSRQKK